MLNLTLVLNSSFIKLFRTKVQQLINKDSTLVNSKYKNGTTALSVALKYKNLPIAEILLSNGANVNAQDNDGHTALHLVVDTIQVYYEFFENILPIAMII
ncbi:ankyrin repeat family protein [Orientia tsutsugamushi str. UT76]|nr:ankyrin repeat family protein [Orientia tsutsugamushi str. UT76]